MGTKENCVTDPEKLLKIVQDQKVLIAYYKDRLERAEKLLAQYKASIDYQKHDEGYK